MSYQENYCQLLSKIDALERATNKYSVLIVLQHSVEGVVDVRIPALRENNSFLVGFVVLGDESPLEFIITKAKGIIDTIAIDVDCKRYNSNLIRTTATELAEAYGIHVAYYSDYSSWVSSAIAFMFEVERSDGNKEFYNRKRLLTGRNALASRMIMEMIARGMDVYLLESEYSRGGMPIPGGGIDIESKFVHVIHDMSNMAFDVLIGCELEQKCRNATIIGSMSFEYIYDIGTCNFTSDFILEQQKNGAKVYRSDDRAGISGVITYLLETKALVSSRMGRSRVGDIHLVSGGIIGNKGDIVVDNYCNPHVILGVASGDGTFKSSLSDQEKDRIDKLSKIL